jgi:preprotein translocase subunit SecA
MARKVAWLEPQMERLSDAEMKQRSRELRRRAGEGESLDKLLVEAFALVREASRRSIGLRQFDVQVLGGIALHKGCIVEMDTGEGKTLVATMPAYLNALTGRGVHIVTVNDYLAERDANWMGPIYKTLGLTVSCILNQMNDAERFAAYRADITYVTSKELGFDFLRDRLKSFKAPESNWATIMGSSRTKPQLVQREYHFAIVDEADSILIDEARTPMIIAAQTGRPNNDQVERFLWADAVARQLRDTDDYKFDTVKRKVELTQEGCRRLRTFNQTAAVKPLGMEAIYEFVERAALAHRGYLRDRDYVVREQKVIIVDEFTGRMMPGREWQDGIHRAVEAKEGLPITVDTGESARVTVQTYFRKYEKLAGMTGTAASEARELYHMYKTRVFRIPTNRPQQRTRMATRIFANADEKWIAVADEIARLFATGRPILIGTRSIEKSEHLSELLKARNVPHQILNAKEHAREAKIVAEAGRHGMVTVATNMAGRGTDIKLEEGIAGLGGLFVIGTEYHTAQRIDRQLAGRCARQGDPGTVQFFVSLDDEILELIASGERFEDKFVEQAAKARLERLRRWAETVPNAALQRHSLQRFFRNAQRRVENQHFRQRRQLMEIEKAWNEMKKNMGLDPAMDWKQL